VSDDSKVETYDQCPCGGMLRVVASGDMHFDIYGKHVETCMDVYLQCYDCDGWDPVDGHPDATDEFQTEALYRSGVSLLVTRLGELARARDMARHEMQRMQEDLVRVQQVLRTHSNYGHPYGGQL
jgi:hypothetical protein